MEGKEILKKLSDLNAVSGSEYLLQDDLECIFKPYVNEIKKGKMGDFIAIKRGEGEDRLKILITAHVDEIGLMVTDIDERGFVSFTNVGGVDSKTLPAQEVIIHGLRDVYGVIGAKPPHVLTEKDRKKAIKMDEMVIDCGMTKDELKELVKIGDYITIKKESLELLGDFITGKALDNRVGIMALYECAKELNKIKHTADVYFAATTQEERGLLGIKTTTYEVNPDIGIVVDVTFGDKYANPDIQLECGKGVEITIGPNIHPELSEKLIKLADEYGIPYTIDVAPGGTGTETWNLQVTREGVPTLLVSVPIKYMHTSTEIVNYKDIVRAGRLLALFISSLKNWGDIYA
ncbi:MULTISPECIES: M28 family peptidase [unclassified Caloramator]|uniref:M28 family peptidase n=1 Tax=unclassified Caloramator TaxID=2629145 RepID=UPI00237D38A5|nr:MULTISPECIES: M28 family peptidase [unclassified Caloramator]MDO6353497.1 M28 family peptidase [Caloramator sp. CAR-1]WDU83735.1 M28 family peptidase [Caloramator sp. Dgby_cultured_2]